MEENWFSILLKQKLRQNLWFDWFLGDDGRGLNCVNVGENLRGEGWFLLIRPRSCCDSTPM